MLAELLFGDFAETNEEAGACDGRTHLEDPETATGAVASLVSSTPGFPPRVPRGFLSLALPGPVWLVGARR